MRSMPIIGSIAASFHGLGSPEISRRGADFGGGGPGNRSDETAVGRAVDGNHGRTDVLLHPGHRVGTGVGRKAGARNVRSIPRISWSSTARSKRPTRISSTCVSQRAMAR